MDNFSDIKTHITNFLIGSQLRHSAETSKLFDNFIVNKFVIEEHPVKHSKYEVRFFWPSHLFPEVYDFSGFIFNENEYKHKTTTDKYIVTDDNINIKIRKNELHIKNCVQQVGTISQFKKKKKICFPIKKEKIKTLLKQEINFDSTIFETPEDLISELLTFPGIACVDVTKERYVRKMEDDTKIEFSLITINEKQWKTICIESNNIQKVLALSLLINQTGAESLSYGEFLHRTK